MKNLLSGIKSPDHLGALSMETKDLIRHNSEVIERALLKAATFNGLGKLTVTEKPTLSMKEVIKDYNRGVSTEEMQAWVYYKQSLGVPMTGWEAYMIKGTVSSEQLIATDRTMIKDNHFRDLREAIAGEVLGKFIKVHQYAAGDHYNIFRSQEGLFYVSKNKSKVQKSSHTFNKAALEKLVEAGALYYSDGELMPFPIFTYGNMYDIERKLIADKDYIVATYGIEVYAKHEKAIRERKPSLLTVSNPDPNERPQIGLLSRFASDEDFFFITEVREEYMNINQADQFKKTNGQLKAKTKKEKIDIDFDGVTKYSLQQVFTVWLFSLNPDLDFEKSDAVNIADYYVWGKVLKDDDLSSEEKAEIKSSARIEGERLFSRFLNEVLTFEDQQKLDYKWNSIYNAQADLAFERVPVGFAMSRFFKSGVLQLTPIQREGVAFMEMMGSGINAFDVGVGKTMTAIATLANFLSNGKCKRPLIVVPKPTYKKWIREIVGYEDKRTKTFVPGVLSETGVKINDWGNLGTSSVGMNVNKLNLKKAVAENTITVITHEGLTKIGYSENAMRDIFDSLVDILTQEKFKKSDRDKEKELQKIREMMGVGLKDSIADIDTLGFDYVVIDEAHNFKNVFAGVESEEDQNGRKRKLYNMSGSVSSRAQKAFLLLNYIQRKFGRNTMLLTATPFSNSPLEIYSMLSLVAWESLKKNGIENIKTFFDLFVLPTVEWAANYKEEIVEKEVIKSFRNRLLMQKLIYNHIHYKTGEEAGVKRPCKVNLPLLYDFTGKGKRLPMEKQVLTYIRMTPKQREIQNGIVAMFESATQGRGDSAQMFRALNYSLDNALTPFLHSKTPPGDYLDFIRNSPKLNYVMDCISSVKDWHEKRNENVSGQIIYMNRGKVFFPLVKEYLQKELGYKTSIKYGKSVVDEVEIITSDITDGRKENIKEAFLDGVCKIIIGTATIREGIDLQKKGTVIYNTYPEWNPTDIHQLEGRIWRQGNEFGFVRMVMPLIQDSMDVFVFQKLEEKTSRINDIWYRADRGNVLDLESLDPQEVKLALITDVGRLVAMFFDQEKENLNREFRKFLSQLNMLSEVTIDISRYKSTKADLVEKIGYKYNHLLNHICFDNRYLSKETAEDRANFKDRKLIYDHAKGLKDDLDRLKETGYADDKDMLSVLRKMERYQRELNIPMYDLTYRVNWFKEYVSKIRKTERTVLQPRGYTIDSDLSTLLDDLKKEKIAIIRKSFTYSDMTNAKRWQDMEDAVLYDEYRFKDLSFNKTSANKSDRYLELLEEIQTKKSTLNVEGKTAVERAEEFASLNYLLSYKAYDMPRGTCLVPDINPQNEVDEIAIMEMEALALELELELLEI